MTVFLGEFSELDDVVHAFAGRSSFHKDEVGEEQIRADLQGGSVHIACYDEETYEGQAFVLFQKNEMLYEVNGSHCSCHGLEGQWEPEQTSWAALRGRHWDYWEDSSRIADALAELDPSRTAGGA